jgi:dihydrofolate reductase
MTSVFSTISMSLDGFVAGPDPSMEEPLGRGGEDLHQWVVKLQAWREAHGQAGGDADERDPSSAVVREQVAATGATVMGRRMFSGGDGPWEQDGNANGWWGDEPPFHTPVFVLTHHEREPLELGDTTFHFVTGGIEDAIARAKAAAGDKAVHVAGGAEAIQQGLAAGLIEELEVHLAPVLLHGGRPLFEQVGDTRLELVRTVAAPDVTHLRYAVRRA